MAAIVTACLVVGIVVTPADSAAPTRNHGYWIAGANAQVFAFGDAQLYAQRVRRQVRGQIADIAAHPSGRGYWLLGRDGAVYAYGEARDLGQDSAREQDAVAIASTPTGNGYFVVTERGEVHGFGDAVARGSRSARERGEERKIVDIATTPSGGGYWLVDANGQVSAFGDAIGFGSLPRNGRDEEDDRSGDDRSDIVAIGATARGDGYWLASASGQVFAFGAAPRFAPLADPARGRHDEEDNERKAKKIVDLTTTWTGRGYWLVDRDGLVFAFGDAALYGEFARRDLRSGQVVAIVSTPFVNHDPVAVNDTAALDEDTTVDINVLANDTDEDGDPLTGAVLTQPAHGTATLNPDGTIRYAPTHDYNGSDAFTYRVTDGFGGSATSTVRLTVRPVNDAPIAFDDAFTIDEDTALSDSVTKNDTDVDGDALTGRLLTAPAHGVATLGADGTFTYTPAANYNGDDSFTYRAFDGALESGTAATVYIHINAVNDAPVGAADTATVNEDEVLTVAPPGVLANDTDVESDPLTVSLVSGPAHGTLSLTPNGGYTYTPAHDFNGADAFTYRASDGLLQSGDTTVTITVVPVNDAPVAAPDSWDGLEDTAVVVGAPGVLANDVDVDGDTLTIEIVTTTTHGTLTALSDGGFSYVPSANFFGDDSFTYVARDPALGSAIVTSTIHVVAVPDPPLTTADVFEGTEDAVLTVNAPGVLANDSDVDSTTITAVLVTQPVHGTLVLAGDGSFTYTPEPNFNGVDTFTYRASDGVLQSGDTTVTLGIAAVNDPPVAAPDSYTIDEDVALVIPAPGVMTNDTDLDGDVLQVRLATPPEHGDLTLLADGSFEYVPAPNYNGSDAFTYDLSDGQTVVSATVTITINPVNDPPSALDDSYTTRVGTTLTVAAPGVLANDFDDTGTLTAVVVTQPAHGTLSLGSNGAFTYTTSLTVAGDDTFTYKVTDGTVESAPATVHLSVQAASSGGGSGTFSGFIGPSQAIYDVDELNLHVTGSVGPAPRLGKIVVKYGSAWYVPNRGARGHDSFTVGGRRFEVDVLSDVWGD